MKTFRYYAIIQEKGKSPKKTAVFDYTVNTSHNASFCSFETLFKDCDGFRLLLKQVLLILHDDPPLNRYIKSIPLEIFSFTI